MLIGHVLTLCYSDEEPCEGNGDGKYAAQTKLVAPSGKDMSFDSSPRRSVDSSDQKRYEHKKSSASPSSSAQKHPSKQPRFGNTAPPQYHNDGVHTEEVVSMHVDHVVPFTED